MILWFHTTPLLLPGNGYYLEFSQNCERLVLDSLCRSIRPSTWNNSAPTGRIFMKFVYFSKIYGENSNLFFQNTTRITNNLHKDVSTHMIMSRWIHFRTRNILDKICGENHNTLSMVSNFFPRKSCLLRDNVER